MSPHGNPRPAGRTIYSLICAAMLLAAAGREKLVVQLLGQHLNSAPAAQFLFTETGELGVSLPESNDQFALYSLPMEIKAAEYSLQLARRRLVPAMGGSFALTDYDADGRPDIFVLVPGGSNHLFRNRGGRLEDVTMRAGIATSGDGVSATFADYDHSGYPSLFIAGWGGAKLYRNKGDGTFVDETQRSGLQSASTQLYTHATFFDVDNDGFLDVLLTAYTDFRVPPPRPAFIFPNDFPGELSRLYRNNGDGTFTDITAGLDVEPNPGRARHAVSADFDGDGHQDLLLLREEKPPILYRNRGNGAFEDFTYDADEQLTRNAFFDAQVADFNHDGKPDLALWSSLASRVLLNQGGARFELPDSWPTLVSLSNPFGFHGTVADVDGDGFDDLLAADHGGGWRVLLNRAGSFHEAGVRVVPETSKGPRIYSAAAALRLEPSGPLYIFGLQFDGRLTVLKVEGRIRR
jgi:hypothetical protein